MYLLREGPGLTMECPLWSLQVDEAGEGGGGMSGLKVEELADSRLLLSRGSLQQQMLKR